MPSDQKQFGVRLSDTEIAAIEAVKRPDETVPAFIKRAAIEKSKGLAGSPSEGAAKAPRKTPVRNPRSTRLCKTHGSLVVRPGNRCGQAGCNG